MIKKYLILLWLIIAVVLLGAGVYLAAAPDTPGVTFIGAPPAMGVQVSRTYIAGAVAHPGVYIWATPITVLELIERAGGFADEVDHNFVSQELNLAELVSDEEHIFIPFSSAFLGTSGAENSLSIGSTGTGISINSASEADLVTLPGIGPSLAGEIINARPFSAVTDLLDVPGIGEQKFSQLKGLVSL